VIDERQHQADLTQIVARGSARYPDAFMLPDLATEFSDLDKDTSMPPEAREARSSRRKTAMPRSRGYPRDLAVASAPTRFTSATSNTSSRLMAR